MYDNLSSRPRTSKNKPLGTKGKHLPTDRQALVAVDVLRQAGLATSHRDRHRRVHHATALGIALVDHASSSAGRKRAKALTAPDVRANTDSAAPTRPHSRYRPAIGRLTSIAGEARPPRHRPDTLMRREGSRGHRSAVTRPLS